MYVKTDYDGCEYITAGKAYEVYYVSPMGFHWIMSDWDEKFPLKPNIPCAVFDEKGTWTICDKEGNEL